MVQKSQFEQSAKKFKADKVKNRIKLKPESDYIIQDTDKAIVL